MSTHDERAREGGGVGDERAHKEVEHRSIPRADTIVQPRAVVIELGDAPGGSGCAAWMRDAMKGRAAWRGGLAGLGGVTRGGRAPPTRAAVLRA